MEKLSEMREVKKAREDELLKRAGVTGVDIGYKITDGEKTGEPAIRVFVEEKKDKEDIPEDELIPKTIERTISDRKIFQDKKQIVRSQHLANWRLSNTDRKSIDRAGTYLATFPTVTFREYIQLPDAISRRDR